MKGNAIPIQVSRDLLQVPIPDLLRFLAIMLKQLSWAPGFMAMFAAFYSEQCREGVRGTG